MNCDWTKENVVLFIYGELADDAKFEFEQHVRHCLGCRRELETSLEFKDSMAAAAREGSFAQLFSVQSNAVAGSVGARGAVTQHL